MYHGRAQQVVSCLLKQLVDSAATGWSSNWPPPYRGRAAEGSDIRVVTPAGSPEVNVRPGLPTIGAEHRSVLQSNHVSLPTAAVNSLIGVAYSMRSIKS